MRLNAEDITIAVTVFNRRQFLSQAIGSALAQTIPVRVIVVEDHGPDPSLQALVRKEFGSRIEYFRNPSRRGLFDNWNACLEYCSTPWLSILHDDDFLDRCFIEAMLELHRNAPDCGLYFGGTQIVDTQGQPQSFGMRPALTIPWRRVELRDALEITPFPFPGNLFGVEQARAVGGFRATSQFCGDWEMWCRLIAFYGSAETAKIVAYNRAHVGLERGTSKITLNGRLRPLVFVQQKRVLHLMRQAGDRVRFDRRDFLRRSPMSIKYLLEYGGGLSPRLRRYLFGLILQSSPPNLAYAFFRAAARGFGERLLSLLIWLWRVAAHQKRQGNQTPQFASSSNLSAPSISK